MNEQHIADQIRKALNAGLRELPAEVVARLRASREQALARLRSARPVAGLATAGSGSFGVGTGPFHLRLWLPVGALVLALAVFAYWKKLESVPETAELDAALLSGDLPPAAYIDPKFNSWLTRSEQ